MKKLMLILKPRLLKKSFPSNDKMKAEEKALHVKSFEKDLERAKVF